MFLVKDDIKRFKFGFECITKVIFCILLDVAPQLAMYFLRSCKSFPF